MEDLAEQKGIKLLQSDRFLNLFKLWFEQNIRSLQSNDRVVTIGRRLLQLNILQPTLCKQTGYTP